MRAFVRPLCIALGLALPIAAQRFVPIDQSPLSGYALQRGVDSFFGDVDRDGDVDFVYANGSVVRNDGARRFVASVPGTDIPFRQPGPSGLAATPTIWDLVDLDGDGILDLLSFDLPFSATSSLAAMVGRGNGSFQPLAVLASTGLVFGVPSKARDIDGDNRPDVFVRGMNGSGLLRNLGNLAFADVSVTHLPVVLQTSSFVPLDFADIDRDGDLDMLTVRSPSVQELWRNDGTGVFTADPVNNLQPFGPFTLAAFFDQDQDLDQDLLVLDDATGTLRLLTNNSGVFSPSAIALTNGFAVNVFAVGDVDGDAVPDVVALTGPTAAGSIVTFGNRITSMPVVATSPARRSALAGTYLFELLDLDRDGDRDLVLDTDGMFLGDRRGGFRPWSLPAVPRPQAGETVLPEDIDGDGDLDLLVGSQRMLQDGDGRFPSSALTLPGDAVARALVDFDLDGDRDVVYTSRSLQSTDPQACGFAVRVGSSFAPIPFGTGVVHGELAAGDLDGDGLPDLVAGDGSVLLNVAGAFFAPGVGLPVTTTAPVVVADFTGDGLRDVVHGLRLYRNTGSANFVAVGLLQFQSNATQCYDLATADLDNDGDADLAVRSDEPNGGDTRIYLQTPLGLVPTGATYDPNRSWHLTVGLFDVDSDGLVDVVDGSVWKNVGGGLFTFLETLPVGSEDVLADNWVAADFDRDGDVDLAAGFSAHVRVFANRKRQVRSPRVPTLGNAYEVEFAVEAGWTASTGVVLPLLALQRRTPVVVPPFGLLHVDAARAFVLPALVTNASGTATLSFVVPNDPALDGVEFYWQALGQQGPSLRLTNVWRERIVR